MSGTIPRDPFKFSAYEDHRELSRIVAQGQTIIGMVLGAMLYAELCTHNLYRLYC